MRSVLADIGVVWRWSVRVWRHAPGLVAWIIGGSVPTAVLLVSFPWLWQYVIDAAGTGADPVVLRSLAGWMLAVGVGHAVVFTALQGARAVGNALVSRVARDAVVASISAADPDALRSWSTGDLVSRLHDDAGDKIGWFLCSGVFRAWESGLVALACLGLMLATEPGLAIWVVAPLPFLIVVQALAQTALARGHRRVQRAIAVVSHELTTTFSSIRVVQACGLGGLAQRRFSDAAGAQRSAEVRVAVLQQGVQLLYQYGWQLAMVALLWFGGVRVLDGQMSLGRYLTFEGLLAAMIWPMFDLGLLASRLPLAAVGLRRLDNVIALPQLPESPTTGEGAAARGLTLVDDEGQVLVEGVDLEVRPGQRVALVGEVGAGKSLVIEALSGLRRPGRGEVLRGRAAPVPQVAVLLSDSVRHNVLLGREVDDAVLDRAVRVSQLARDLPRLARGLDTEVGERGAALSGGQRQRVALARALVGQPRVLLLDDATSALDADVEAAFWQALAEEEPEIGALLVTHRVGILAGADEVVVLERGRVVQRGTHRALMDRDGPYRRMYG